MKDEFIKASVQVKLPKIPNYLIFRELRGKISIADVPREDLENIGQEWMARLIDRAQEIRDGREASEPFKRPDKG